MMGEAGGGRMTEDSRVEMADDDAESAGAVICMRLTSPLMMPDNVIGVCSQCGEAIQHRPHVPRTPLKICCECLGPLAKVEVEKGDPVTVVITPKIVAELAACLRKKNAN
jgi:hypothetical protein